MPILTQTFAGSPGGMNLALPPQEIDDTEARYIQDALLDYPGLIRRRGPVNPKSGWTYLPRPASALMSTRDPAGVQQYAAMTGTTANGYFTAIAADKASTVDLTWPFALPTSPETSAAYAYRITDTKPALKGGTWVGTASDWTSASPSEGLALWRGAVKANYTTGTLSVTRGSTTVTGAGTTWTGNVVPGMFLFADTDDPYTSAYIGTVLSVGSSTSITLEAASPFTCTAKGYTLQSIRGFIPKVSKGRITCDTSVTTVSGGGTKFQDQGLGSGAWHLFRQSDMVYVGKVSSVQSNLSLTLTANAAVAMADQAYVAIRGDWTANDKGIDITSSANKVGFLNAIYAERQWYANNGAQFDKTWRLWFSDTVDGEAVDLTADGDWIPISSTSDIPEPVRGLAACYNSLLVFKESETFAVFGNSPSSFAPKKIEDDGVLSTMSIQSWGGGGLWAGKNGIYFFDGITVNNMTAEKLGDVWRNSIRTIDPTRYRMWSMMARNHYFLFIENLAPTVYLRKGTVGTTPTSWVVVINMESRAITLHTNLRMRGSVGLPTEDGGGSLYVVNGSYGGTQAANNLGKTAAGASAENLLVDQMYAVKVTAAANGATDRVKWRLDGGGTGAGNAQFRAAIYADSSGEPGALLGLSTAETITDAAAAADVTFVFSDSVRLVNGTSYWLALHGDANADSCRVFYDTLSNISRTVADTFADGTPTTWNAAGDTVTSNQYTAYAVYDTKRGWICSADGLFDTEGIDVIYPDDQPRGPDFYYESKKFNAGDDMRLKRFKQLAIMYMSQGAGLKIDTLLGLNNLGTTLTSTFPATVMTWAQLVAAVSSWTGLDDQYATWNDLIQGVFAPKRVRFLKKTTHFSFRLWQENANASRVRVGPSHLGFKMMREGGSRVAYNEQTISEWTPSVLVKFIQDLLQTQPPSLIPLLKAEQIQVEKNLIYKDLLTYPTPNWRKVGNVGQPAFENSWVNYGGGYSEAMFWKDSYNWVHLRGLINSGTVGSTAFTLPPGFIPPAAEVFGVVSNGAAGRVDVTAAGAVIPMTPSNNTWVTLSGTSSELS